MEDELKADAAFLRSAVCVCALYILVVVVQLYTRI
jgi:hypothetical protein